MISFFCYWFACIRASLVRAMEFRSQFFGWGAIGLVWIGFLFLTTHIVFARSTTVAGWTETEAALLIALWGIIHEIHDIFFIQGLSRLPEEVNKGTFDYIIIRPRNALLQLLVSRLDASTVVQFFAYSISALIIIRHAHIITTPSRMLMVIFLGFCGIGIQLGLNIILVSGTFWFGNISNIRYLYSSITEIGRFPAVIFRSFQFLFFTFIPVAYLGNVQTQALVNGASLFMIIKIIIITTIFLVCAFGIFHIGARKYTSASS